MDTKKLRKVLGWSALINYGLLIVAVGISFIAHDRVYDMNQLFITISVETYDAILFIILAIWEVLIWVFFIVPYIVLRLIVKS